MKHSVAVTLTNRFAYFTDDVYPEEELREFYSYRPPGYFWSPKYRMGGWDGWVQMLRTDRLPTGLFLDTRQQCEQELQLRFRVNDARTVPGFSALPERLTRKAWAHQLEAVERMHAAAGTGGLVLNATGSGKTFTTGLYLATLQGTACFVVDELTLLEQAWRELREVLGEKVGWIGEQKFKLQRVTVATIQTLFRHRQDKVFRRWFRNLDVLILDEIHLALNRRNVSVVRTIRPKAVYGLTATLELEKKHVRMRATALAGPPIYDYPLKTGVEEGVLSHGVVVRVLFPQPGPLKEDYQRAYRRLVVESPERNDCIEALTREALRRHHRVVLLVERLAHLDEMSTRLRDVYHVVASGECARERRTEAKQEMDRGSLRLIIANRVFAKGVNIKHVDVIVDGTASRSKNSARQRYGRGTRLAHGKLGLIYLDIADQDNRFAACSRGRLRAYRDLGVPVRRVPWMGDATRVLQRAQRLLQSTA